MTHQETLKGRALADKLGAVLIALQDIEARSTVLLSACRSEIGEAIAQLADAHATEARGEFLARFNLEVSTS